MYIEDNYFFALLRSCLTYLKNHLWEGTF